MKTEAEIRNTLVRKVLEIPAKKLNLLSDFVSKLENTGSKKSDILSFSGVWSDIDDSVFTDLTEKLSQNRQSTRKPIDESIFN
ncbi:MAG: hypothetical protein GDA51_05205 [Ekhidna sp.]|nr:hypothetical protein [Ekhidna sp.]